jgi:hypothetical protein
MKVDRPQERFAEWLRFLLCRDEAGKQMDFLEFVPGDCVWRPDEAYHQDSSQSAHRRIVRRRNPAVRM